MNVLVVDVGGTNVKLLQAGRADPVKFGSGSKLTPEDLVAGVMRLTRDWSYDAVSIGIPAPVVAGRLKTEPFHLGHGWLDFDFSAAFGKPVQLINDAAMQALGSYQGGRMLFLGLGTGLGAALVLDGMLQPLELGRLPYRKRKTFEDYVGVAGLKDLGQRKWERHVWAVVEMLYDAFLVEYIVLGGGNAKLLDNVPEYVRLGSNANARVGGERLWTNSTGAPRA